MINVGVTNCRTEAGIRHSIGTSIKHWFKVGIPLKKKQNIGHPKDVVKKNEVVSERRQLGRTTTRWRGGARVRWRKRREKEVPGQKY